MNSSIFFSEAFRRAALASAVAFGASSSFAANATSTSTATVIEPVTITKSADLVFGRFTNGGGGTVTVATNGDRTASGPILSTIGSTPTAAQFDVTGDDDATYGITWGTASVLTDAVSSETMALGRITALAASSGTTVTDVSNGTLSASGTQSIYLGGVLTVGAAQAEGAYTGDVTATVEYN
jgi:hypothetical protein